MNFGSVFQFVSSDIHKKAKHNVCFFFPLSYECVKLQYLNETLSQHHSSWEYWIVTKCPVDKRTFDDENGELCEHPGLNGNIESLQPVSDLTDTTHFRNKYCAFCNGRYDINTNNKWKLQVHCDEIISLADDDILDTIVSKKCNILYEPPTTAKLDACRDWPIYNITSCNITGKWDSYDEYIERACNAFVDPFNQTYQNYFCMLCNTPTKLQSQNHTTCRGKKDSIVSVSPPFFAILDIDLWREQQGLFPKLTCNGTQFKDTKFVSFQNLPRYPTNLLQKKMKNNYIEQHMFGMKMSFVVQNYDY